MKSAGIKPLNACEDKELADKWRAGVDENFKLAMALIDRGYKFNCLKHGAGLEFHPSSDIQIVRQEKVEL